MHSACTPHASPPSFLCGLCAVPLAARTLQANRTRSMTCGVTLQAAPPSPATFSRYTAAVAWPALAPTHAPSCVCTIARIINFILIASGLHLRCVWVASGLHIVHALSSGCISATATSTPEVSPPRDARDIPRYPEVSPPGDARDIPRYPEVSPPGDVRGLGSGV